MDQKSYTITVDGIGSFTFRRRTMRDEMRIGAEFSRLTEGVETLSSWFASLSDMLAVLKVLTVEAPDGWDIDEMDPLDADTYTRITRVFSALREREEFFRKGRRAGSEAQGPGAGRDAGVVVPPAVPPSAD